MGIISDTYTTIKNKAEMARVESDSKNRRTTAQTEMDEDIYFREYEVKYQERINDIEARRTQAQSMTDTIKRDRIEALIQRDEADVVLQHKLLMSKKNKMKIMLENKDLFEELKQLEKEAGIEPTDFTKLLS